jgi:hypothetical protein
VRTSGDDYTYRSGAPMRGGGSVGTTSALHRTHSATAATRPKRLSSDADGIQLKTLIGDGAGRYASLPTVSSHSDVSVDAATSIEDEDDAHYYSRTTSISTDNGTQRSISGSNAGSYVPGILTTFGSFLPGSILPKGGAKLERAGSDDELCGQEREAGNTLSGQFKGAGASAAVDKMEKGGGYGVASTTSTDGAAGRTNGGADAATVGGHSKGGVGSAKGYYTSASQATIKQRTSSGAGGGASAGAGAVTVATGPGGGTGGCGSGRSTAAGSSQGSGKSRSASLDSAEESGAFL